MKKTQTLTSNSSRNAPNAPSCFDLPVIRIVSTEDEMHTKMNLEMEDETHDMLVEWGKEVATDNNYIQIAIMHGLEEYLKSQKD